MIWISPAPQKTPAEAANSNNPCTRSITVFLGGYLDRGPASRQVIDLLGTCKQTRETIALKGNHETFVHRFLAYPSTFDEWRSRGGLETLISYGLQPSIRLGRLERGHLATEFARAIPPKHYAFFDSLEVSFCFSDFLFVHAGVRPGIPIHRQQEDDLLWIRDEFLSWNRPFEKFAVHGHTPVPVPNIRSSRANIDTGAFATGRLTCIAIEGSRIITLLGVRNWAQKADTRNSRYPETRAECALQG